jgi:signal transduction histidine kinase
MTAPTASRVALHLVSGGLLATATGLALTLLGLLWGAALWSLIETPAGRPGLVGIYVVAVLTGPFALSGVAGAFAARQRARFRRTLGVDIPAPARSGGWWRPGEPWHAAGTWRRLGFHLYALAVDVPGTVLVVAPPAARRLARLDVRLARALLGPGRAERLAGQVETLSRSRAEVVAAADAERRRIERDLHDGTQQRLVSLAMNLGLARRSLPPSPEREVIESAHDEAVAALAELREFVRGLHPAVLDDRGLDAAVSGIAARAPLSVRVTVDVEPRCSPAIEAIAYFTVSEALTNVAKHAAATRATVTLRRTGDRLHVAVTDDGRGGAVAGADGGLAGLARRAAGVDGTMTVDSPAGGPTTVTVELPCG